MTVINTGSTAGMYKTQADNCTFCNRKIHAPFVYWNISQGAGEVETWICADCCVDLRKGLMQDMIQVGASREIERATGERLLMVRATPAELSGGNATGRDVLKAVK